ncbi:uncharacterized protein C2845_PM07G02500 [Panicum miliaceum]|uniref:Uncharacterized protein n=1 Tax=Panicum miliaceum TaxID=4540 RepID=A0A3L6SRS1_PANMI|nr:uncharacterized protein C2845_PM07G02500 [Panicum miliaceum]
MRAIFVPSPAIFGQRLYNARELPTPRRRPPSRRGSQPVRPPSFLDDGSARIDRRHQETRRRVAAPAHRALPLLVLPPRRRGVRLRRRRRRRVGGRGDGRPAPADPRDARRGAQLGAAREWAAWEKEWYGTYDADVCELVGALQAFLVSSRPGVGVGILAVLVLAVPASAFVLVSHLLDASRAIITSLHH